MMIGGLVNIGVSRVFSLLTMFNLMRKCIPTYIMYDGCGMGVLRVDLCK